MPLWLLGSMSDLTLLPGLPVSSLMAVCPLVAAAIVVGMRGGRSEVWRFLGRVFDCRRLRGVGWWALAVLFMPAVMLASFLVQTALGDEVPEPQISLVQLVGLFVLFFIVATTEELGWTGHATEPLVRRWGFVCAGILLGVFTAAWHLFPLLQADRSWDWIAWWALASVTKRFIIMWLYMDGGRSVFAASMFHAMSNLSWMAFPVMGSHYDPRVTSLILVGSGVVFGLIAMKRGKIA